MDFRDRFKLTAPGPVGLSGIARLWPTLSDPPAPGLYNDGILCLPHVDLAIGMLDDFHGLVPHGAVVLVTTGLGDAFYWDRNQHQIRFLDVQSAETAEIGPDNDPSYFLDSILVSADIEKDVLRASHFEAVKRKIGPLAYPQCYILAPMLMLGGEEKIENYMVGDVGVSLSIAGQTATPQGASDDVPPPHKNG